MKKLVLFSLLPLFFCPAAHAQTPGDSTEVDTYWTEYPSLKENYHAHAAFVLDNRWTTTLGSKPLGRRWQDVADEFELSPEGNAAYAQARRQIQRSSVFSLVGLGLTAGGLSILSNLTGSAVGTGVGIGTSLASIGFSAASVSSRAKAMRNFEKALWLRNRDAMLDYLSPTDQPRFRYLYETETIRLANGGNYLKNGQKHRLGMFANNAASEFENIPDASVLFKEYQKYQRSGVMVYGVGLGTMVAAFPIYAANGRLSAFFIPYFGGVVSTMLARSLLENGRKRLRQAIHFRNYAVMERKMLRD